jgi:hypothetical protein
MFFKFIQKITKTGDVFNTSWETVELPATGAPGASARIVLVAAAHEAGVPICPWGGPQI